MRHVCGTGPNYEFNLVTQFRPHVKEVWKSP